MKKLFYLLLFLLVSCAAENKKETAGSPDETYRFVQSGHKTPGEKFGLEIPVSMEETTELNKTAQMQYQNLDEEIYFIVISESKKGYLALMEKEKGMIDSLSLVENYRRSQVRLLARSLQNMKEKKTEWLTINGLNAVAQEITGQYTGVQTSIGFFFAFIAGENNMYMFMGWTMEEKRDQYRAMFSRMAHSFRLLKK